MEIWDEKKKKSVVLLTNNLDFTVEDLAEIYRLRDYRKSLQTTQAEFSSSFLLWRQCECHTDSNVGGTYR